MQCCNTQDPRIVGGYFVVEQVGCLAGGRLSDSRQKTWPMVTVVIVNWNGERFLDRCLIALLAQTAKPHEIILLDNANSKLNQTGKSAFSSKSDKICFILSVESQAFYKFGCGRF